MAHDRHSEAGSKGYPAHSANVANNTTPSGHAAAPLPPSPLRALSITSETKQQQAQILLQYVAYGDKTKAEAMLERDPSLLLLASTVTDYSKRTYQNFTPLQLAYAVGDVAIYPEKEYEGMAEMIMRYFDKLPEGRTAAAKQIQDKFQEGLTERSAFDFNPLIEVIANSSAQEVEDVLSLKLDAMRESKLWKELEAFRESFALLSQKEERYNPNHLLAAFETYDRELECDPKDCRLADWKKRDLFLRQVIGYAQRYMPAFDAQVFAQGVHNVVNHQEAEYRSFKFRHGEGSIFPPSPSGEAISGLGYEYASEGAAGQLRSTRHLNLQVAKQRFNALKKYAQEKTEALSKLQASCKQAVLETPQTAQRVQKRTVG